MHSILRQQEAQFVAVGGCGCPIYIVIYCSILPGELQMSVVCVAELCYLPPPLYRPLCYNIMR